MNSKIYQLLAYIISSAIGCLKEPKIYGPLRLIDTTEKIILLFSDLGLFQEKQLTDIANIIDEEKWLCMNDELAFVQMLINVSDKLAQLMDE